MYKNASARRFGEFSFYKDFHKRLEDFSWVIDWKAKGEKYASVYFIASEKRNPVKIGYSKDVSRRIGDIQGGNWEVLFPIKSILCKSTSDAKALEKQMHSVLKSKNLSGEWFDLDALEAFDCAQYELGRIGIEPVDISGEAIRDEILNTVRKVCRFELWCDKETGDSVREIALRDYGVSRSVLSKLRIDT